MRSNPEQIDKVSQELLLQPFVFLQYRHFPRLLDSEICRRRENVCRAVLYWQMGQAEEHGQKQLELLCNVRFCRAFLLPQAIVRPSSCRGRWFEVAERRWMAGKKQLLVLVVGKQGPILALMVE